MFYFKDSEFPNSETQTGTTGIYRYGFDIHDKATNWKRWKKLWKIV